MSDARPTPRANRSLPTRRAADLARWRPEPTPAERAKVRKNRMWLLLLMGGPICLALVCLLLLDGGSTGPIVNPISTPAGYTAVTDAYFGYAVPEGYGQNATWTDANGDFLYGTAGAFVAETERESTHAPGADTAAPPSFKAFGVTRVTSFTQHPAHRITVPGTRVAYEELITRPNGVVATAVDAWERDTSTQVWLLVRAPPAVVRTVIASLQG